LTRKYNIIICPLEWGLGHAGRMVPLARKLKEAGHNVIIGAGDELRSFFMSELKVATVGFPGYRPSYSRFLPQYLALLMRIPALIAGIISENHRIKKIIAGNNIDILISDNRFGLWNRSVTTVYITHQIRIPFPSRLRFLEWSGILFHRFFINKFDFCFIPDLPGDINLSGRLSHGLRLPSNTKFIGILSRFTISEKPGPVARHDLPHNTIILSGPEPQRSILRQKLINIFQDKEMVTVILEGRPSDLQETSRSGNLIFYNHPASEKMQMIISGSTNIITRSGYSSIMELVSLNCGALLVPTPGQTEQEYLAEYLAGKEWFTTVKQRNLDETLKLPGKRSSDFSNMLAESNRLLDKALEDLLQKPDQQS